MFKLCLIAGVGFTLLAVAPFVLNVPKILTTVSVDLAILCLVMAAIIFYHVRSDHHDRHGPY